MRLKVLIGALCYLCRSIQQYIHNKTHYKYKELFNNASVIEAAALSIEDITQSLQVPKTKMKL